MTRRRDIKVDGERIRSQRLALGLTLVEVADQSGISRSYLAYLETGERHTITLSNAVRLAAALKVPTEEVAA